MRRLIPSLALALSCAACNPTPESTPGTGPTAPATAPASTGGAVSGWAQAAGGPGRTSVTTDPGPRALPGIAWTNPVAQGMVSEPVFASIGGKPAVLMGSGTEVLAFDVETGRTAWTAQTGSPVDAAPAVAGDSCWVLLLDGKVQRLALADGKLVKEVEHDFALEGTPLVVGGMIVYEETSTSSTVTDSRLHAVDAASGVERWGFDYPLGAGRAPSTDGTRVFVAANDGVHAISLSDGKEVWRHSRPPGVRAYSPVVSGGRVVAVRSASFEGGIDALDAATGTLAWSVKLPARAAAPAAVTDAEILVPLMDGKVHRLALADGSALGVLDAGARCEVRPVLTPERIYLATGQTVVAFDRKTLAEAWRLELESLEVSKAGIVHMAVFGTKLIVARLDGNLHALEAPGGA